MGMKNKIFAIVITILLCSGVVILNATDRSEESGNITIIDMEGTSVSIPENVERVACISSSATDLMIAFGLGEKIVGTYRSFTYNPWTSEICPAAANFKGYSYSVSAETLLADDIQLVILQNTENAQALRNAGLPVVAVHQYSPNGPFDDHICDIARLIGDIFGGESKDKADAWIKDVKDTIKEINDSIGTTETDKLVYYVNGEKSKGLYYSDGGNSMISSLLRISNMKLATEAYHVLNVHSVSDEEMVSLNPYAIIIGGAYQNDLIDDLNASPIWSALDANSNNRVYRIPVAMIGIENVSAETPVMMKYLANLFFPSQYSFDIYEGLRSNIQTYFNYTLTDADIDNMCQGLSKTGQRMV